MMRTEFFADPVSFSAAVEPLVATDPVGAIMFAGVLASQIDAPYPGGKPLLATVAYQDRIELAALRIPRYPMLLVVNPGAPDRSAVLAELVGAIIARGASVIGFSARRATAYLLARVWTERTGVRPEPGMTTLLHRLGTLVDPIGVPGSPRVASVQNPADVDLLASWWFAFRREAGVEAMAAAAPNPDMVLRAAERGDVVTIWCDDDGRPVAAAAHSPVRAGTAKIAPVYTPPTERRRGFASAVTAAAVRSARRLGATEVVLFTDASYEPSNIVYRKLGFEQVAECAEFEIGGAEAASTST
jgi:L-amino acid N-acyltransferase YncA